jgi:hypothetical protein
MAYTTLVAGTTITAAWANASVRDQSVSPFATTAARDSAITSPVTGMVTYISSNDSAEGILTRASGSIWRQPWNMPWGLVAGAVSDVIQSTTSGTTADWGGITCSFTGITTRRYKVTASFIANIAGAFTGTILITDLVNNQYSKTSVTNTADFAFTLVAYAPSGISGAVGFKLRGSTTGGTLTICSANAFSTRSSIFVEDMGPSGAPA